MKFYFASIRALLSVLRQFEVFEPWALVSLFINLKILIAFWVSFLFLILCALTI